MLELKTETLHTKTRGRPPGYQLLHPMAPPKAFWARRRGVSRMRMSRTLPTAFQSAAEPSEPISGSTPHGLSRPARQALRSHTRNAPRILQAGYRGGRAHGPSLMLQLVKGGQRLGKSRAVTVQEAQASPVSEMPPTSCREGRLARSVRGRRSGFRAHSSNSGLGTHAPGRRSTRWHRNLWTRAPPRDDEGITLKVR